MSGRALALAFLALAVAGGAAMAAPYAEGYRKCEKCHEAEVEVWKQTEHFKSFQTVHRKEEAKAILDAAGGGASMRQNSSCVLCHYTETQSSPSAKPQVASGPSCESCHGPSSDWRDVHNFYGNGIEDPAKEPPANKSKRLAEARKAGMIWSFMTYDIAANCNECHGLANPKLSGEVLAKMLDAGHPSEPEFELVRYSQGTVRHRFYPPDYSKNAEMSPAELEEGAIPPTLTGPAPDGWCTGRNAIGRRGWMPIMPPPGHGPHRYAFQIFVLNAEPRFAGREERAADGGGRARGRRAAAATDWR